MYNYFYFYKPCSCSSQWSQSTEMFFVVVWFDVLCLHKTFLLWWCCMEAFIKLIQIETFHFCIVVLEGYLEGCGRVGEFHQKHALQAGTAQSSKDKWCDTPFYWITALMKDNLVTSAWKGWINYASPDVMALLCLDSSPNHLESFSELMDGCFHPPLPSVCLTSWPLTKGFI